MRCKPWKGIRMMLPQSDRLVLLSAGLLLAGCVLANQPIRAENAACGAGAADDPCANRSDDADAFVDHSLRVTLRPGQISSYTPWCAKFVSQCVSHSVTTSVGDKRSVDLAQQLQSGGVTLP